MIGASLSGITFILYLVQLQYSKELGLIPRSVWIYANGFWILHRLFSCGLGVVTIYYKMNLTCFILI